MTAKNPLLKYVMKTKTPEVLHSSGYAKAQNANSFGTATTETFGERRRIEEQRKFIRGYRNSRLANTVTGIPRPKTYTPPTPAANAKPIPAPRPAPTPIRKPPQTP